MARLERLSDLLQARSQAEASIAVTAKASYFPGFVRIYQPHKPIRKISTKFSPMPYKQKRASSFATEPAEDNIQRSLRRTKATVLAYALCNTYELFATFTFASERQDIGRCEERMNNWLKNQKKRTSPNLKYLIVAELHKDNQSLHFHALLAGFNGTLRKAINPETGKQRRRGGRPRYNIPSFRSGFTDAVKIGQTFEDQQKTGRYIAKYLTKDMPRFKNRHRYWASYGHRRPLEQDNPPLELLTEPPVWQKTNEYGTVSIFPYTEELTDYLNSRGFTVSVGSKPKC